MGSAPSEVLVRKTVNRENQNTNLENAKEIVWSRRIPQRLSKETRPTDSSGKVWGVAKTPSFAFHANTSSENPKRALNAEVSAPFNIIPPMFEEKTEAPAVFSDAEEVSLSGDEQGPPTQISEGWGSLSDEEIESLKNEIDQLLEGHEEAMSYTSLVLSTKSSRSNTLSTVLSQSSQNSVMRPVESIFDAHVRANVHTVRKGNTVEPLPGVLPNKVNWKASSELLKQEKLLQKKAKLESTKRYLEEMMGTEKWTELERFLSTKRMHSASMIISGFDVEKFKEANSKRTLTVGEINTMMKDEPNDSILNFILKLNQPPEARESKTCSEISEKQNRSRRNYGKISREVTYTEEEKSLIDSIEKEYDSGSIISIKTATTVKS